MSERRLTYSFGPLERRGLLGPVTGAQAAWLAAGTLVALFAVDRSPTPAGVATALAALALAVTVCFVPLAGHCAAEWAPLAAAFAGRRLGRRHRFVSLAPTTGATARGLAGEPAPLMRAPAAALPRPLEGVRIVTADYRGQTLGALSEHSGRRLTAVLACRVLAFSLLDADAQERRLARWGHVLAGLGGSPVRRLQWIERTAPAAGDELARWVHAERDPAVPLRGAPMIDSYLELIGSSAAATRSHEILIAVQVDGRTARERGARPLAQTVVEAAERVARGLEAAEVSVLGALGPGQLARTLRTAFDPYTGVDLARLESADPQRDGLAESEAWPLGTEESWDHYRTDGALHATYWIAGWPRVEVSPLFMDALLGSSSVVRTVAVSFEPVAPDRSTREVEAAITRDRADRELRARFGQSETARQRQAREATARREAELAAGHGEVRLSGFVTVSGRNHDDLRRSCAEVLDLAARSHLELRRLYGQQADAFTFTLPLGRGLR